MFDSADVREERFWRAGIARIAVFFRSFVALKARKGRSEKRGGAKGRLPKMSTKFAPRLRARAIRKSKSLKTGMPGAFLEVHIDKICTTPACESDLEVKIVKTWGFRRAFRSSSRQNGHRASSRAIRKSKSLKTDGLGTFLEVSSGFRVAGAGISTFCKMRGRRRNSWGLQKRWRAWWIWRGSETIRFAWQAQGFRALRCGYAQARDAESVEGLQISCYGNVTLQGSFRVAVTGVRMPWLNFFVAGAILLKHPFKNRQNVL